MTELDKIRAEIVKRRDAWAIESRVVDQNHALAVAELEAHDRAVAAMGAPPADSTPTRNSVKGPVMALFRPGHYGTQSMDGIVRETGLPELSVHKFLARAVKAKMLQRAPNGEYGLPVNRAPLPSESAQAAK